MAGSGGSSGPPSTLRSGSGSTRKANLTTTEADENKHVDSQVVVGITQKIHKFGDGGVVREDNLKTKVSNGEDPGGLCVSHEYVKSSGIVLQISKTSSTLEDRSIVLGNRRSAIFGRGGFKHEPRAK